MTQPKKTQNPPSLTPLFISADNPPKHTPDAHQIGEKGRNLVELARLGAPVPSCAMLPAEFCDRVLQNGNLDEGARKLIEQCISHLEETTGAQFGNSKNPLIISLRGSSPFAIPDSPETILNLGLTEEMAGEMAKKPARAREAWDAYRRLILGFAHSVAGPENGPTNGGNNGVMDNLLEDLLSAALEAEGVEADCELSAEALKKLALDMKAAYEEAVTAASPKISAEAVTAASPKNSAAAAGTAFPKDAKAQLEQAVLAFCHTWDTPKALEYRLENNLEDSPGTGLIMQTMAWGTGTGAKGSLSGAGSLATRTPGSGEKKAHGQYLDSAMGTDLTAGIRMTEQVATLESKSPEVFKELMGWADKLERHFHDAVELQFSLNQGKLSLLGTRPANRTAKAGLRIALDLKAEGICDEKQALALVNPGIVEEYLHPVLDKSTAPDPLTKGLPASPGSAVGQVVFFAEHAVELASQGIKTILVRHETTPEDIDGLKVSEGIVTVHGGLTSHAAVVARGMGKCCIVGVSGIQVNYNINEMTIGEHTVRRLDWLSIDGNTGEIYAGEIPQVQPALEGGVATVLEWADKYRTLGVYANADNAEDAKRAVEMGAGGIGLCRTEHMFFEIDRIPLFRKMILAMNEVGRAAALSELLPLQRKDFMDIFRVMEGKPVTIRLLDPPLNEFLPRGIRSQTRMARAMSISVEMVQQRTDSLSEANPMMGHRGCRLAVTYPEMYQMQTRAIVEAACIVKKEGIAVNPEIMVPLVCTPRELRLLRKQIEELIAIVKTELGEEVDIKVGTMIETPRATVVSRSIANHADFFSFGTNDLTQMGFGFSRDDVGMFLPAYLEKKLLDVDPFIRLDQSGIGRLMKIACEEGRAINPKLKLGICGEHGGEPDSVRYFHDLGLDYVSCSPYRIPVARMAAGQAAVANSSAANSKKAHSNATKA